MQTFDSNGPDVRIRGSAFQVHEKYLQLARDAASSGDRIMAENYLQHAEHYYRIIAAAQEQQQQQQQNGGDPNRRYRPDGGYGQDYRGQGDDEVSGEPGEEMSGQDQSDGQPRPEGYYRPQQDNRPQQHDSRGSQQDGRSYQDGRAYQDGRQPHEGRPHYDNRPGHDGRPRQDGGYQRQSDGYGQQPEYRSTRDGQYRDQQRPDRTGDYEGEGDRPAEERPRVRQFDERDAPSDSHAQQVDNVPAEQPVTETVSAEPAPPPVSEIELPLAPPPPRRGRPRRPRSQPTDTAPEIIEG